jgi:hypothetical protein
MKEMIPLLVAVISAIALFTGYVIQKWLERVAENRRHKQELYTQLVQSMRKREDIVENLSRSPRWPAFDDPDFIVKTWNILQESTEGNKILAENREIVSLFVIYADDEAIDAYVKYLTRARGEYGKAEPTSEEIMADFIKELRTLAQRGTKVTSAAIRQAIYNPAL